MTSEYRTRDGRAVRVLCVDMNDEEYPVVAIVCEEDGSENAYPFTPEGIDYPYDHATQERDLIEVKPSVRLWVNAKLESEASSWAVRIYDTHDDAEEDYDGYDIIARRVELDVLGEEK